MLKVGQTYFMVFRGAWHYVRITVVHDVDTALAEMRPAFTASGAVNTDPKYLFSFTVFSEALVAFEDLPDNVASLIANSSLLA